MWNQEAAVQQTFHRQENQLLYLSALMVRAWCSTSLPAFCTQLHRMQTPTLALQKWSHTPWKPSITRLVKSLSHSATILKIVQWDLLSQGELVQEIFLHYYIFKCNTGIYYVSNLYNWRILPLANVSLVYANLGVLNSKLTNWRMAANIRQISYCSLLLAISWK